MATNTIEHRRNTTVDQRRLPSPAIWADCPWNDINEPRSGVDGVTFFDDFTDWPLPGTQTTEIWLGRYKVFAVTAGVWATDNMPHSTTVATGGGIVSAQPDSDGDAMAFGTQACPFSLLTTQTGKLWYEARVATTSIAANTGQMFVGLGQNSVTTYSSTIPLGNNNATSSALSMIGFNRLENGLGVLNTSYADHATTWTDVQTTANSTLAANTWIKLGMKVDFQDTARCVRFYVDNVECTSAITKAVLLGLTNLDINNLGPLMAVYADSGTSTSTYFYIDWWRVAQTF